MLSFKQVCLVSLFYFSDFEKMFGVTYSSEHLKNQIITLLMFEWIHLLSLTYRQEEYGQNLFQKCDFVKQMFKHISKEKKKEKRKFSLKIAKIFLQVQTVMFLCLTFYIHIRSKSQCCGLFIDFVGN